MSNNKEELKTKIEAEALEYSTKYNHNYCAGAAQTAFAQGMKKVINNPAAYGLQHKQPISISPFGEIINNIGNSIQDSETWHPQYYPAASNEQPNTQPNIPPDFKEVTGFGSPKEMAAYEKGADAREQVIIEWIKKWKGGRNSGLGQILHDTFERLNKQQSI